MTSLDRDFFIKSVLLVGLVGCSNEKKLTEIIPLPYYNSPDFTPEWIPEDDPAYDQIHTITNFSLTDQNGNTITQDTFRDKIYVANFFYTICPSVCPLMTENLLKVQEEFVNDKGLKLLSHTVMPWIDSIATLKRFADLREINSNRWHLVTGPKDAIYAIARESYFADEGFGKSVTDDADFLHTENVILIDRKRRIRGVYNGTLSLEIKRLIEDIRSLREE